MTDVCNKSVTFALESPTCQPACESYPHNGLSRAGLDGPGGGNTRNSVVGHKSKAPPTSSVRDAIGLSHIFSHSVHTSPGQVARFGGSDERLQSSHTYKSVHDPNSCVQYGAFGGVLVGGAFALQGHGELSRGRHQVALCMVCGLRSGGEVSIRPDIG